MPPPDRLRWEGYEILVEKGLQKAGIECDPHVDYGSRPDLEIYTRDGSLVCFAEVKSGRHGDVAQTRAHLEICRENGNKELRYFTPDGTDRLFSEDVKNAIAESGVRVHYHPVDSAKGFREAVGKIKAAVLEVERLDRAPKETVAPGVKGEQAAGRASEHLTAEVAKEAGQVAEPAGEAAQGAAETFKGGADLAKDAGELVSDVISDVIDVVVEPLKKLAEL
jgi:hypothetical protein